MRKKYVVTGGGGFVGRALCLRLLKEGHEVVALARKPYPELEASGARTVQVDLSGDRSLFAAVFNGADAVFHVAAKVDMWGRFSEFFAANVLGTRNVIAACREQGVSKLIYTSSPSVVADGTNLRGIDESYPYPGKFHAWYPYTKSIAEREVLAANASRDFFTISLRPHLIFGPGDQHFVPTILMRARAGKLKRIGSGKNLVDFCYIDDCVEAHICALRALDSNPSCRGKPYFVTQGEPTPLWWWIEQVLEYNGLPPPKRAVPKGLATSVALLSEAAHNFLPWHPEPLLTRFLVSEMTTDHYFSIRRAREDLAYRPACSIKEALARTFLK